MSSSDQTLLEELIHLPSGQKHGFPKEREKEKKTSWHHFSLFFLQCAIIAIEKRLLLMTFINDFIVSYRLAGIVFESRAASPDVLVFIVLLIDFALPTENQIWLLGDNKALN